MSEPKDNPKLRELKRKWEEDHFGLDSAGVYGVGEAIEEAINLISAYDHRQPAVNPASNDEVSRELGRQRKTCRICGYQRRNDPCDQCYKMVRDAAEWTDEQCIMEVYPCAMCDAEVRSTICGTCMDIMLSGE